MSLRDPYSIIVPPEVRAVGQGPFWEPGETVNWTFRRFDFDRDRAEVVRPMRVIADGPQGTVLWLAGGTRTQEARIVGWEDTNPHDVPLAARFRPRAEAPTRINVAGTWRGRGVLKIVPPDVPFSVWILLKDAAGEAGSEGVAGGGGHEAGGGTVDTGPGAIRTEWYINLEATHRRIGHTLFTSDHILDITFPVVSLPLHNRGGFDASGAVFKDVDELAAAANFGAWPADWSQIIRSNGSYLLDHLGDFSWAFDPEWEAVAHDLVNETTPQTETAPLTETTPLTETAPPTETTPLAETGPLTGGDVRSTARLGAASVREKSIDEEHRAVPNGCYDRHHR